MDEAKQMNSEAKMEQVLTPPVYRWQEHSVYI